MKKTEQDLWKRFLKIVRDTEDLFGHRSLAELRLKVLREGFNSSPNCENMVSNELLYDIRGMQVQNHACLSLILEKLYEKEIGK